MTIYRRGSPGWKQRHRQDTNRRMSILREYYSTSEATAVAEAMGESLAMETLRTREARKGRSNTDRAYLADQRDYLAACTKANVDPLNPSEAFWTRYIEDLAKRRHVRKKRSKGTKPKSKDNGGPRRCTTLRRNAYGIADLFLRNDKIPPTWKGYHRRLMRHLARDDLRATRKARPLYGEDAHRLIACYGESSLRDLRDRVLAAFGVNRGFRASTIVGIQIENIEFDPRGVIIRLIDIKTSPDNEPVVTATPHTTNHRSCLPCILKGFESALRELGIVNGPLFFQIDRWGNVRDKALTPKSVTDLLRKGLTRAGIADPKTYTSHSYRHGVVKTAVMAGWSDEEIMMVTLHQSVSGLAAYTTGIDPWRCAPTRSILDVKIFESRDGERGWRHVGAAS